MAITPVTREEKILSGEDIQPRTRMEYFLKKASENGGESGLPEYTSADKGKFLGLGEADPVETEVVVVPEQTLTFAEYVTSGGEITVYLAPLPLDGVTNGAMYTATIDGVEMSSTAALDQITFGQGQFKIRQEIGVSTIPDGWYLNGRSVHAGDSIAFSLKTVQSVTPSVTTVIVPEQTVATASVDTTVSPLQSFGTFTQSIDLSVFDNYDNIVMTVDGTDYEATKTTLSGYGECLAAYDNGSPIYIVNATRFYRGFGVGFRATVSISVVIPNVAPVWENTALIVPLTFDDDAKVYTATKKAEEIYSANSVVFTYNSPIEGVSGMTWKGIIDGAYCFGAFIAGTETVLSASTADDYPTDGN